MSKRKIKVAIGMPVYNGERFLAKTLDNLLGQSFADFEIIISDNASTDRTGEICRQYAAKDERVRYVRQSENLGAISNFNAVFQLSDSEYFKWAAVDDVCDVSFLERAVAILDSDPDVVWCHARSSHIDANGEFLDDPDLLDVSYIERAAPAASARFKAVLLGSGGCLDSYALMRSHAIRRTPLYLPGYGSEKVFIAELALLGRYAEIPETLFFARVVAEGSGNIATATEQQVFADPGKPYAAYFARFIFLAGYLSAIWRSAPSWSERVKCWFVVLRWLMQVSKWLTVLTSTVMGRGVGGGNVDRLRKHETGSRNPDLQHNTGTSG